MATTTFGVRQFFNVPSEEGAFTAPTGTYVVTGSTSRLLVNNNRTNLASDSFTINSNTYNSGTAQGWWPSPDITIQGVIIGGNDSYANSSPDGRISEVSCWGFGSTEGGATQGFNDTEFIALAGTILGTTFANTGSAKTALRNAGFYYQYPVGFDGQSPNTGTGSDVA